MTAESKSNEMMDVRFGPRRLTHVNLFVSDVDESFGFYNSLCGFEEVFAEPAIWARFLGNGNTHHDVALMGAVGTARVGREGHVQVAAERGRRPGLNHLGFEMGIERDLYEAMLRAERAGFQFHRVVDHQISHSLYMFDPDGNYIEVYADVVRDWRELFKQSEGQLITGSWHPDPATVSSEPKFETDPDIHTVDDAAVHPRCVTGATLIVADLATSRAFYGGVVGLRVVEELAGGVVLGGELGGRDLVLVQQVGAESLGLHHFKVELVDPADFDGTVVRLAERGHSPHRMDIGGKRSAVLVDPDGFVMELASGSVGVTGAPVDARWAA
jgi:catechol 2,3-dioxygenase